MKWELPTSLAYGDLCLKTRTPTQLIIGRWVSCYFVVALTIATLFCDRALSASGLVIPRELFFACPIPLKPNKSWSNGYYLIHTGVLGDSLIRTMHQRWGIGSTLALEDARRTPCWIHIEPVTQISDGFQSSLPYPVFPFHLLILRAL